MHLACCRALVFLIPRAYGRATLACLRAYGASCALIPRAWRPGTRRAKASPAPSSCTHLPLSPSPLKGGGGDASREGAATPYACSPSPPLGGGEGWGEEGAFSICAAPAPGAPHHGAVNGARLSGQDGVMKRAGERVTAGRGRRASRAPSAALPGAPGAGKCCLTLSRLVSACLGLSRLVSAKSAKKYSLPDPTSPSSGRGGRARGARGRTRGQATAVTVPPAAGVRLPRRARWAVPVRAMQMPCGVPMKTSNGSFPIALWSGRQGEIPRATTNSGKYSRDIPASRLETATFPGDSRMGTPPHRSTQAESASGACRIM